MKSFNIFAAIGAYTLRLVAETGRLSTFFFNTFRHAFARPFYLATYIKQSELLGFNSLPIVLLTSFFTGGVLALQTYAALDNEALAAKQLGSVVAMSMLRELGPVLASLMVAGRVGAAMAAEIGTMRVTEQIDALVTLATNPMKYLVVPRVLACLTMVPMLVIIANCVGIFGGSIVAQNILNLNGHQFFDSVFNAISGDDLILGLVKAVTFGTIIGIMGCYHGYNSKGGAEGVGRATTVAVVYASVAILVADYFITAIMM